MRVYAINIGPNLLEWRSARGLSPMRADTAQPIKLNDQFTGELSDQLCVRQLKRVSPLIAKYLTRILLKLIVFSGIHRTNRFECHQYIYGIYIGIYLYICSTVLPTILTVRLPFVF